VTLPELEIRHADRGVTAHYLDLNRFEDVVLTRTNVRNLPILPDYQAFAGIVDQAVRGHSVIQLLVIGSF